MNKKQKEIAEIKRLHSIALTPVRTEQEQKELDDYLATLANNWRDWQYNDADDSYNCEPEQFGSIYN